MGNVISTRNLTKVYNGHKANDNITVNIPEGAIYGLIGRNGAGKTTFMKTMLGLIIPDEGTFEIFGKSGDELKEVRRKTGFIIETPAFYSNMSAYDNMVVRAKLCGIKKSEMKFEIEKALKRVGLLEKSKMSVKKYSMGMRQSLGIAMAILGEPKLLILDEPINGLDPIAIAMIREMLIELNKNGTTIIISSHILGELEKLATSYGFILDGKLVKETTEEEVQKNGIDLEKMFIELAKREL